MSRGLEVVVDVKGGFVILQIRAASLVTQLILTPDEAEAVGELLKRAHQRETDEPNRN